MKDIVTIYSCVYYFQGTIGSNCLLCCLLFSGTCMKYIVNVYYVHIHIYHNQIFY